MMPYFIEIVNKKTLGKDRYCAGLQITIRVQLPCLNLIEAKMKRDT